MLENKSRDLVLLREEIAFLTYYVSLVTIRWESAFRLDMGVETWMEEAFLIPPISLQLLVENAIKHNEFSEERPLVIRVALEDAVLTVEHEKRKKPQRKASSRIGLANLNDRYQLTTDRNIVVQEEEGRFVVRLPLLPA
jgi:LytS/YehU family sensor histidine kinase